MMYKIRHTHKYLRTPVHRHSVLACKLNGQLYLSVTIHGACIAAHLSKELLGNIEEC